MKQTVLANKMQKNVKISNRVYHKVLKKLLTLIVLYFYNNIGAYRSMLRAQVKFEKFIFMHQRCISPTLVTTLVLPFAKLPQKSVTYNIIKRNLSTISDPHKKTKDEIIIHGLKDGYRPGITFRVIHASEAFTKDGKYTAKAKKIKENLKNFDYILVKYYERTPYHHELSNFLFKILHVTNYVLKHKQNPKLPPYKYDPIKITQTDPVKVTQTDPVKVTQTDPVKVTQTDPVKVTQTDPVKVTQTDPLKLNQTELDAIIHGWCVEVLQKRKPRSFKDVQQKLRLPCVPFTAAFYKSWQSLIRRNPVFYLADFMLIHRSKSISKFLFSEYGSEIFTKMIILPVNDDYCFNHQPQFLHPIQMPSYYMPPWGSPSDLEYTFEDPIINPEALSQNSDETTYEDDQSKK